MINDDLAEAILSRELNLNRFDAELRKKVSAKLANMDNEVLNKIKGDITQWNRAYFNENLRDLRKIIDDYYAEVADMTTKDMKELENIEVNWLHSTINDLVGVKLFEKPSATYKDKLSFESLVQGATLASWWLKLSADAYFRVSTQMRIGYGSENKNVSEKVKEQLKINQKSAETIAQNAVHSIASNSRELVYEKNKQFIGGKKFVAMLDNRTSLGCIAYDGSTYTMDNKKIGTTTLPYASVPRHFNCRSIYVPYLKSANDIGGLPETIRKSMDGGVPITISFEQFMKKKGEEFQNAVLGSAKAQLWREGKINLRQLIDQSGNPLTLKQLKELDK